MEKEREEAKAKAQVARSVAVVEGDAKARAEEELARVQDALEAAKEARLRLMLRLRFPAWRLIGLAFCLISK